MRATAMGVVLAAGLLLSGCVTAIKEREVRSALRGLGISETDVTCLAARAGRRLTVAQLRQLERAAAALPQPVSEKSVGEAVAAVRDNVDSSTIRIVVDLSIECAKLRVQEKLG